MYRIDATNCFLEKERFKKDIECKNKYHFSCARINNYYQKNVFAYSDLLLC